MPFYVQVLVSLNAAAVPLLNGTLECAISVFCSSMHCKNARFVAVLDGGPHSLEGNLLTVLVDPQTGLLPQPCVV